MENYVRSDGKKVPKESASSFKETVPVSRETLSSLLLLLRTERLTIKFATFSTLQQRHSHPDLDRERPLSKASSEISYDALSNKSYKSSNDIRLSTGYQIQGDDNNNDSNNSQRNSYASNESKEPGRMVSGNRRNLPKHQRPLTRYLPILSADLNLRLHIESAGHQINLCPNVIIDAYSCRG